jgi:phosphatidylglycerophosphatase A
MQFHKIIASCGGLGYIPKGSGTFAALFYILVWIGVTSTTGNSFCKEQVFVFFLISVAGVVSGNKVEKVWGKDSKKVVIDELAGMSLSLLCFPPKWYYAVMAFVLFRFFDIAKPFYIKQTEKLPGGWGVMMDDWVAALYANLVLHGIAVFFK